MDLLQIQFMLTRSGWSYHRTKITRAADMAEPREMGATLEQMLQALLEDRQRQKQELLEERE